VSSIVNDTNAMPGYSISNSGIFGGNTYVLYTYDYISLNMIFYNKIDNKIHKKTHYT